jgi:hypothetical protein
MNSKAKIESMMPKFSLRTSLVVSAKFCQTLHPMWWLLLHSNRRVLLVAVTVSLPLFAGGCALWNEDRWNLDHYRDERAVDIEKRLERDEPIVKNPF